ncbi:hypothetical protein [Gordonia hongkongensis]|uniref:hypothetical protein n=1 Tax=Gordonia hongkongensis TaxID=1701090 RepID=UPI003D711CA4
MIEQFFTWPVVVERKIGTNTHGPVFAAPDTVMCRVRMETRVVTTESGSEVTTVATASCAASTPTIPADSRATLPAALACNADGSPRKGVVAVESRHDAGLSLSYYQFQIAGGA